MLSSVLNSLCSAKNIRTGGKIQSRCPTYVSCRTKRCMGHDAHECDDLHVACRMVPCSKITIFFKGLLPTHLAQNIFYICLNILLLAHQFHVMCRDVFAFYSMSGTWQICT